VGDVLDVFAPQVVVCSEVDDAQFAEQVRKHIEITTAARSLHITVNSEAEGQGDVERRAVDKAVCVVLVLPQHHTRFTASLFDDEGSGISMSSSSALTWRKLLVHTNQTQLVLVMTPYSLTLSTLLATVRCTDMHFSSQRCIADEILCNTQSTGCDNAVSHTLAFVGCGHPVDGRAGERIKFGCPHAKAASALKPRSVWEWLGAVWTKS